MNRVTRVFSTVRAQRRKALIAFVMAGDPSLTDTARLMHRLDAAGVDILELGIPFSDPLADGPTIQAAAERALKSATTLRRVLRLVQRFRRQSARPVVLLSYVNPLLRFGGAVSTTMSVGAACHAFFRAARRAGVEGVVIPDLPIEESRSVRQMGDRYGVAVMPLAAPTSPPARLRAIAQSARGFIYYVSVTGTTGARRQLPDTVITGVQRLKRLTRVPVCVGFGISTPQQARRIARVADGVIIGSALVQRWARHHSLRAVEQFIHTLRHAIQSR